MHSCLQVDEVDESLLTQLAYNARGDVCPMQGVIGGITAQEVMKVRRYVLSKREKDYASTYIVPKVCVPLCRLSKAQCCSTRDLGSEF